MVDAAALYELTQPLAKALLILNRGQYTVLEIKVATVLHLLLVFGQLQKWHCLSVKMALARH